jgi:hypothetical protein
MGGQYSNQSAAGGTYNEKIMVRGEDERGSPDNEFDQYKDDGINDRELSPNERPSIAERPSLMT